MFCSEATVLRSDAGLLRVEKSGAYTSSPPSLASPSLHAAHIRWLAFIQQLHEH
jgi:hypothetical protein